jgi:hypothetical protein
MDETGWVEVTREGGKKQGQFQDLSPDQQQSNALMVPKFDSSDPCTYSTMRKYSCSMSAGSDSSEPVQRCHRIEQLLKKCPGRLVSPPLFLHDFASIDCAQHVVWLGGIFDWIPVQMFLILRLCQGRRGSRVFLFLLCVLLNWTAVGMASCVDLYVYFHFGQFTVEE